MSLFRSIEKKLEGLVEGGFGRAFKSSVQPVELAHKLAKEMGDHKTVGVSNVYVPNEFDVYLGADDFAHLTSFEDSLKSELSNYVTAFARREGWTLVAPPRIELHRDEDLRVGEFGIATRTVGAPQEARPAGGAMPGAQIADPYAEAALPLSPYAGPEGPLGAATVRAQPVAVPPVAAQAPGPGLDQTLLYQESAPPYVPAAAAAQGAGPRAVLHSRQGDYALTGPVTVIGRSRRCDIVVSDPNVSRQHVEIRRQDDGFLLSDLGSTNGTRLNRREVKQAVLQHGDRIELGTTELVFERQS